MKNLSLRTKGLLIIILISFVPLIIVGLYNYTSVKKEMIATEIDKIRLKQESRSYILSSWLEVRKAEVLVMSRTNEVRSGDTTKMMEYLQHEQMLNSFQYQEIGFITADGMITNLKGNEPKLSDRFPIARVLRGDIVLTDPVVVPNSSMRVGYMSVPVHSMDEANEFIGALYVAYHFPPTAYEQMLQIEGGNLYLYNHSGELLYDHLQTDFNKQEDEVLRSHLKQLAALALTREAGYEQIDIINNPYMFFYQKIDDTNWVILEVKDLALLEKLAQPTLWRMLMIATGAIVVLGFFLYLYFQTIITRLEAILQVTKQAAAGHFNAGHLDASNFDEIGVIANTVNGMMGRLQIMFDRLDAVINQNQSPVFVIDERYIITYMNQAAEKMTGYTSEEVVGKMTPLLFMDEDEVHEKARWLSEQIGKEVQPGIDTFIELRNYYPTYDYELTIIARDGKRIPVYNRSSSLRDRNGQYSGIIAILSDMSEQRMLESARNRLQMVVESAKDLIASVDRYSNLIYINEAGRKMLGLSKEEIEGQPLRSILPTHLFRQLLRGAITARKNGFFECDAQFQNIAGKFINVSIVIVAYEDTFTGEMLYSCISRDITEQLEVQRKLVRATEVAEEANQAKSTFLALMSHEIRTPLNGIIGLAQLLQKTELDFTQTEYIQHMRESSNLLLSIVNDILDFSKLEANKIEPDLVVFQLPMVISYLAEQLSLFLGGKEQFEFIIHIDEDVPYHVLGDSLRLEQVLSNLCVNAIKFTEQGTVELKISVVSQSEDEWVLQFTVEDTGIGMSAEQLKYLFKPFKQADSSTTRKYGGTGLGLVISKNLVELLGGSLEVISELGKGSTFVFTLPFKQVDYQRTETEVKRDALAVMEESIVWVVEDHAVMASHWNKLLAAKGYNAVHQHTWKDAYLRLMRLGEGAYPAFILADMEMSDMYGMDTWLEFQQAAFTRDIPIIALTTAYGREELLGLEQVLQPSAILTKPVTPSRFTDAVALVVHIKQSSGHASDEAKEHMETVIANELIAATQPQHYVLLAEDNKVNQLVAAEMLKHFDCKVTIASNGIEAVQYVQLNHYDLVLMDIHMPEMDGLEATKSIRRGKKNKDIPIVAVTANVLVSDHERYLLHGMNAVITKPLSIDELQDVLEQYIFKKGSKPSLAVEGKSIRELDDQLIGKLEALHTLEAKQALERVNGKLNIYKHMLQQYVKDYSTFVPRLKQQYKNNDYAEITRSLHTLKGASSYLGAERVQQLAIEGERIAREDEASMLLQYFDRLEVELNKLMEDITSLSL